MNTKKTRTLQVTTIVLITLFSVSKTSPILETTSTCDQRQCPSEAKSVYEIGKTYQYDYHVEAITEMKKGAPDKSSRMEIAGRVSISALSTCELSLSVEEMVLNGASPQVSQAFGAALKRSPTQFYLEEGRASLICSEMNEPTWVENIKKGIISSFQSGSVPSTNVNVTEIDVTGECQTEFVPISIDEASTTYAKVKHMDTCRDNQRLFQFALNIPDLNVQKLPIVKSEQTCQVTVESQGKLQSSDCSATHVFQPFSSTTSAAQTSLRQTVKFVGEMTSTSGNRFANGKSSSLLFKHDEEKDNDSDEKAKRVLELLDDLRTSAAARRPEIFTDLVHSMRSLSHAQLMNVFYNGITDSETRRFALDAVPLVKTDAAFTLMKDIIESRELPLNTLDQWFETLPFYKNPTRGMISMGLNFLKGEPRNSAMIGVASMVNTFCNNHKSCHDLPEVQAVVSKYEEFLGTSCSVLGRQDEDRTILALRALRTLGKMDDGHAVVEECYKDSSNSMFIRLAALDTVRELSCTEPVFKRQLVATFSNTKMDSELRIGAYLALMNCPTQTTVNLVKNILVSEPVNQVGSFVWTHLTNLQESQSLSAYKQDLKKLVGSDFLQNKWKTDVRKFSRFFESSYHSKDLNLGATTDGQIIFSQDSYLPRSAMVNLTANIFGENLHLMEVGARVEGFESVVENLFGPDGYFREDSLHKLLQTFRQKRNVGDSISDFQSTYNKDVFDNSPRGNMYMRMLGRDLHYTSFDGLSHLMSKVSSAWPLNIVSANNIDYKRSSIFLDGKIVVPTLAGFPLDLAVNGTSAMSLQSHHSIDVADMFSKGNAALNIQFYPSVTFEISAAMTLDARFQKTGLKSLSKLHSNTFWDGQMTMEGGKLMKAQINVPRDTMEVLDVDVDFLTLTKSGKYESIESTNEAKVFNGCTPDYMNTFLGVKFCGSALYHDNPMDQLDLAFSGPSSVHISMDKVDTFDKYTFEYEWSMEESSKSKLVATFDTPLSKINRRSSLNVLYNPNSFDYVSVNMEVPVRDTQVNALYQWTDDRKILKASVNIDNEEFFSIFNSLKRQDHGKYDAKSNMKISGREMYDWTGSFLKTGSKLDIGTSLSSVFLPGPITFSGNLLNTNDRWDISGQLESFWLKSDVTGLFQQTDTSFNFKTDLSYAFNNGNRDNVQFQCSYKINQLGDLEKHLFFLNIDPKNHAQWNTALSWEIQISNSYLENTIKARVGNHAYEIDQLFSSQASIHYQELLLSLGLKSPNSGVEYRFDLEHRLGGQKNVNRLLLKLPRWIDFQVFLTHEKEPTRQKVEAGLNYNQAEFGAGIELNRKHDAMDGVAFLRWGPENDPHTNAKGEFELRILDAALHSYNIKAKLTWPEVDSLEADGTLQLRDDLFKLHLGCKQAQASFEANVELSKPSSERIVFDSNIKTPSSLYSAKMVARIDVVKSIHMEVDVGQKYVLNAVARREFRDLLFDLTYGSQPEDRLLVKAAITPQNLVTEFKVMGNHGKFEAQVDETSLRVQGRYNDDKVNILGNMKNEPGDHVLTGEIESTIPFLRVVQLELKHFMQHDQILTKAKLIWNDDEHAIKITGEKQNNVWVQLETTSAYETLDDLFLRFENSREDILHKTFLSLRYKGDEIKWQTTYDNTKPKKGELLIKTPWSCVNELSAGFLFNYGRQIQMDTYFSLNKEQLATANVTGHILPNDVDLDFQIVQKTIGEANGRLMFKKSSSGIKGATRLSYADNSFSLEGEYQPMPFKINGKLDITTEVLLARSEFDIFKGYGATDIKFNFDHGNKRYADIHWNSWFESVMEHRFNADVKIGHHGLKLNSNNDKGRQADFEVTYLKNEQLLSNFKMSTINLNGSEGRKHHFNAVIFHNQKKTSVDVTHDSNVTSCTSWLKLQSHHNFVELQHDTEFSRPDESTLKLGSLVKLSTPFEKIKLAKMSADILLNFITPTEMKMIGNTLFSLNDKAINLELIADGKIQKDVTQVSLETNTEGFLGTYSAKSQLKFHSEGFFLTSTITDTSNQEYLLVMNIMKAEEGFNGAALHFELDVPTENTNIVLNAEAKVSDDKRKFFKKADLAHNTVTVFDTSMEVKNINEEWTMDGFFKSVVVFGNSPLSFQGAYKNAALSAELTVPDFLMISSTTKWTNENLASSAQVTMQGSNCGYNTEWVSDDVQKTIDLSLKWNAFTWHATGLLQNDEAQTQAKINLETSDNKGALNLGYKKGDNAWDVLFQINEQKLTTKGQIGCMSVGHCSLDGSIQTNISPSLAQVKVSGSFDSRDKKSTSVSFVASMNYDHKIELSGEIGDSKGEFSLTVNSNLWESGSLKSIKGHYEITANGGRVEMATEVANILQLTWKNEGNAFEAQLITPYKSIKELRVLKRKVVNQDLQEQRLEIDVNNERLLTFEGHLQRQKKAFGFKLTSTMESLQHLEMVLKMQSAADFHMAAMYNNVFETRILGSLNNQVCTYKATVQVPYLEMSYVAAFAYDFQQQSEKHFELSLSANERKNYIVGNVMHDHAVLTVESCFFDGKKVLEANWDLQTGLIYVVAKDGDVEAFVCDVKIAQGNDPYQGSANMTMKSIFLSEPINLYTDFDVGKEKKSAAVIGSFGGHFITMSTIFKMGDDTFNGELLWKSSIPGLETAIINARYNIAVEPTAFISVERNGHVDFIKTKLTFDNVIPTIRIMTSFQGFEKLIFKGNYKTPQENHVQADVVLARNDENIFVLATSFKRSSSWEDCEINIDILTPISGWEHMNIEAGWKSQRDPYALKMKLVRGNDEINFKGKLSIRQQEFSLSLITPFENYESISLSGKLGTTSLGRHMGVSFENNAVRRDVSFAYSFDEQKRAIVQIKTPLEQYKEIKVRSMMMADMGKQFDFAFESQGNQNDMAFGLFYDFGNGISDGVVLLKVKAAPMADIEAKLSWNDVDGRFDNGFGGSFYFKKDGSILASGKIDRVPGHTSAQIKTPIPGYENIAFDGKAAYGDFVSASVEINESLNSIYVKKVGEKDYDVTIKTPMRGYEKIEVSARTSGTKTVFDVARNGKKISSVTVDADVNLQEKRGKISVKLEATANLWAQIGISYENNVATFTLKAPNKDWKVTFQYRDDGTTSMTTLNANIDGEKLFYSSERVWNPGHIVGQSKLSTTMDFFETKNQDTSYEIKYSEDMSTPFELFYESKNDGVTQLLINLKADVDFPRKLHLTCLVKYPEILPNDIDIEIIGETDGQKSFKLDVRYDTTKIALVMERTDNEATIRATSNIAGFENMAIKAKWTATSQRVKVDAQVEWNAQTLVKGSLAFDMNPFTRLKVAVNFDSYSQEMELKWKATHGKEYQVQINTEGTFSQVEFKSIITLNDGKGESLECSLKGGSLIFGTNADLLFKLGLKHDGKSFGITALAQKEQMKCRAIVQLELESNFAGKAVANVDIPGLVKLTSNLNFDLESHKKVVNARTKTDNMVMEMTGEVEWSPSGADIVIRGVANGKKIEFIAKRDGLTKMEYRLDVLGKQITLASVNDITDSQNFDVDAKLSFSDADITKGFLQNLQLTVSTKSSKPGDIDVKSNVAIDGESSIDITYWHKNEGDQFELIVKSIQLGKQFRAAFLNKDDGKEVSVDIGGDIVIKVFENVSTGANPMIIKIEATETNNDKSFKATLDLSGKSLMLRGGNSEKYFQFKSQAKIEGKDYYLNMEGGDQSDEQKFQLEASLSYPLKWNVETKFSDAQVTLNVDIDSSLTSGSLKAELKSPQKTASLDLTLVNQDIKLAEVKVKYDSQSLKMKAKAKPGEVELEITSTLPKLENIELEVEYGENKLEVKMEYQEMKVTAKFNNDDNKLVFNVNALDEHKIDFAYDKSANTLVFDSNVAGKEVSVDIKFSSSDVEVEVNEPFMGMGKIKLSGSWQKKADGTVSLKATGDINAMDYKLAAEIGKEKVTLSITRGAQEWSGEANLEDTANGKSLTIRLKGTEMETFKVDGYYGLSAKDFASGVNVEIPSYVPNLKVDVSAEFDFPQNMNFKAVAVMNGEKWVFLEAGVNLAEDFKDMRSTFLFLAPPLGLSKKLGMEVAYRLIGAKDFELKAVLRTPTNAFQAGVKFHLEDDSIDIELLFGLGEKEMKVNLEGSKTVTGNMQNIKLKINNVVIEANVNMEEMDFDLKINGQKVDANGDEDPLFSYIGLNSVGFLFAYEHKESIKIEGKADDNLARAIITFTTKKLHGAFMVKAGSYGLHKSAEVMVIYGTKGIIEVTLGGIETHQMSLQWPSEASRMTRATFSSPRFGQYDFMMDQDVSSGIFVLSIGDGIHKLTYDLNKEDGIELTATLESKLLSNGHATLHFKCSPNDKNISLRLAANNEHFASLSLSYDCRDIQASLSLQSNLLQSPISINTRVQNENGIHAITFKVEWADQDHLCHTQINILAKTLDFTLSSPLIPGEEWSVKGKMAQGPENTLEVEAVADIALQRVEFNGNITYMDCTNFKGTLVYQGSAPSLKKANLDFQVQINQQETILMLDLTTTHPSMKRAKFLLNAVEAGTDSYAGTFVGIMPEVSSVEATFHVPRNNWENNNANFTISTMSDHIVLRTAWNLEEEKKTITALVLGPTANRMAVTLELLSDALTIETDSSLDLVDGIKLQASWDPQMSKQLGSLAITLERQQAELEVAVKYKFDQNAKIIETSLATPLEGYENYAFKLGYEDSERKTAKAFVATPSGETGLQFDYHFKSLANFMLEVEVDLPIPELKVTQFKIGHILNENEHQVLIGGEWKEFAAQFDYKHKTDETAGSLWDVVARYNKIILDGHTFLNSAEAKIDVELKAETPWGNIHVPFSMKCPSDLDFMVEINEVTHFALSKSAVTKTMSLEIRDIIFPSSIKLAVTFDSKESFSGSSEIVWDTTNAAETTELLSFSWRKLESVCEFQAQVTWPTQDTDAISGKMDKKPGQLQATISVLHNNQRLWGLDTSIQSEYQGQDIDHAEKIAIVFPDLNLEYDFHLRYRHEATHHTGSLLWSTSNGHKKGLEYVYDVEKQSDDDISYTMIVRKVGRHVQTFTSRFEETNGATRKAVYVDINHSHDESRCMNVQASLDTSNTNDNRMTAKFESAHKFGMREMSKSKGDLALDTENRQISIEYNNGQTSFACQGKLTQQEQNGVEVACTKNGKESLNLAVETDPIKIQSTAKLMYGQSALQVFGGFEEPNLIRAFVKSQSGNSEIETSRDEIDIKLMLSPDGRVLKVEMDWRPEVGEYSHEAIDSLKNTMLMREGLLPRDLMENLAVFERIVRLTVDESAQDIKDTLNVDLEKHLDIARTFVANFQSLYINQAEVVQTVTVYAGKLISVAAHEMALLHKKAMLIGQPFVEVIQEVINECITYIFDHSKDSLQQLTRIEMAFLKEFASLEVGEINTGEYVKITVTFVREGLEKLTELYSQLREKLEWIPTQVTNELDADVHHFFTQLTQYLKKFKEFNEILTFYWDYQSWFEEFHLSSRFEEVTYDIRSYLSGIGHQLYKLKIDLMDYWNKTVGLVNKTLSDYPLLAYGLSVGKKFVRVAKAMAEQMSIESNLRNWLGRFIGRADAVASTLVRLIDVVYHGKDLMSYDLQYDLSNGHVAYHQVLPFQWYAFMDTPDIFKVADLVGIGSVDSSSTEPLDVKALQHDILEVMGAVSQALRTKTVIPPFSATALVAAEAHIITFDQTFYDFAGSRGCSYLLTSDFSHGRFSAIANYDEDMRRTSIDVISDGQTINIDTRAESQTDGLIKVTLNKRNAQLPLQFDHTYVFRQENTIVVENSEGLRVSCNTVYNVCTFTISGWYFGKTGGLLGIYDNEPANDWMTSDRQIVSALEDFVSSWSVTSDRQCPVRLFPNTPEPTTEESEACDAIFASDVDLSSSLMPCFSTIDPRPFKSMCLRDMQALKNQADKRQGVCSAAAAYIEQCQQAGVELWMPAQCVMCGMNNEVMRHGESSRIESNAPQTADVVFVVQQSQCMNDVRLGDLPYLINRSLKSKGVMDSRFALVGFGGADQLEQPHIFTSGSQIFNDVSRMTTAISNLRSDGHNGTGDIFEALQYAARLNFRPGVMKTFVLVRCDNAQSLTSRAYGDSMTMLVEQGIVLHSLTPLDLRLKGSRVKLTAKMYGFTKDAVITASHLDTGLRRQLKDPKDLVSTLAQETGGSVFDMNRLEGRRRISSKKASTMMGKVIAELSQPLDCQVCDCLADADGRGRLMCHRCVLPSIDIVLQNLETMLE